MARAAGLAIAAVLVLAATTSAEQVGRALYHAGFPGSAGLLLDGPAWDGAVLYAQKRFGEAATAFETASADVADYDRGTALARAGRLDDAVKALEDALYRNPNDEDARYNLALVESLKAKRGRPERDAKNPANADASQQKRGGEAPTDAENEINSTGEGMAGDRDSGREARESGRSQVSRMGRAEQTQADDRQQKARGAIGASEGSGRNGGEGAKVAKSFEQLVKLPKKSYSQQTVQPSPQWLETISDEPGRFLRLKLAAERTGRAERGLAAPQVTDPW
ncbi:tetratricopeptide repeat protein [Methylopila sp. M107]|uniref:tetratricopeptide repeat protein n=1 Tax=Methylopila sp. M107 TaxID=1101190 RepID=UPI0003687878|nr:tetratricopeptide repeat protein [Methylopila sp. M107]